MKKMFLTSLLFLSAIVPDISYGAIKSVTIDWTISDTTNITGYRMYYAYSSDMASKTVACTTNDPSTATLTCANICIASTPVYFVIAAVTAAGELNSQSKSYVPPISVVMNFSILSP